MEFSSQITFLYFEDLAAAKDFFDNVLKLEVVYDPIWSCVWRTSAQAYIGAVDNNRGAIKAIARDGVLVSFTVKDVDAAYNYLKEVLPPQDISEIRFLEDIGLKTFIITGPEGYKFEIQQFSTYELCNLF